MVNQIQSLKSRRGGFTLVELLVVVVIIAIIVGLLAMAAMKALNSAGRAAARADLQTIAAALQLYHNDHGMYPPVRSPSVGARVLCQALIGPGPATVDGADGLGFRTTRLAGADGILGNSDDEFQGRVYPAYLQVDSFLLADPANPSERLEDHEKQNLAIAHKGAQRLVNSDTAGMDDGPIWPVILYYPANAAVKNLTVENSFVAVEDRGVSPPVVAKFDYADHPTGTTTNGWPSLRAMRILLGDFDRSEFVDSPSDTPTTPGSTANGRIDAGESAVETEPYILWSPGTDGFYGPMWLPPDAPPSAQSFMGDLLYSTDMPELNNEQKQGIRQLLRECDDVTNFDFEERLQ